MLQLLMAATGNQAVMKVGAQHRQRHVAKARQEQLLHLVEGGGEGGIHGLFDEAAGRLRSVADREQ